MISLQKIDKDHWTATYLDVQGEGKGPLSAVHDLFEKIHAEDLTVVEISINSGLGVKVP